MVDQAAFDPQALAGQLGSTDAARRADAAERLAQAGESAAVAAVALVRACGDTDDQIREWAVAALEGIGPPPPGSLGELTGLIGSRNPLEGYWATTLLGRSGAAAAAAVAALAACIDSAAADLSVRQRAAWALGQIGPAAKAARDALGRAAGGSDPRLARLAHEALEAIGT